eukprot:gene22384-34277_t
MPQISLNLVGSGSIVICLIGAVVLTISLSFTSSKNHLDELQSYGSGSLDQCYETGVSDAVDMVQTIMNRKMKHMQTLMYNLVGEFHRIDATLRAALKGRDDATQNELLADLMPLLASMWSEESISYLTIMDDVGNGVGFFEQAWMYTDDPSYMKALRVGDTVWSDTISLASSVGVMLLSKFPLRHGTPLLTGVAFGLTAVTNSLSEVVDSVTERLFVVSRRRSETGFLAGVSHGVAAKLREGRNPFTGGMENRTFPIHSTEASDPVIRLASQIAHDEFNALNPAVREAFDADIFHPMYLRQQESVTPLEITLSINTTESPVFLHSLGETLNEIEPTSYYIEIVPMKDTAQLNWWIVLCIEKNVVTRHLETSGTAALARQAVAFDGDKSDAEESYLINIAIVFFLTLLAAIFSIVVTLRVTKPLSELEKKMMDVSSMKLEGATDLASTYLTEVHSMQGSFKKMVAALEEYRQFLPAALLARNETGDDEDDGKLEGGIVPSPASSANRYGKPGQQGKAYLIDNDSSQQASSAGNSHAAGGNNIRAMLRVGIRVKAKVVELMLGMSDFPTYLKQELSAGDGAASVTDFHSKYLQLVFTELQLNQGSLVSFQADEIHADFKGILPCNGVSEKATRFSFSVLAGHQKHLEALGEGPTGKRSLHIGAALGPCYAGNMGTAYMKNIQVLGEAVRLASMMQTVASEMGVGIVVNVPLSDQLPQEEYFTATVDCIVLDSMVYQAIAIVEKPKNRGTPSWMYASAPPVDTTYAAAWSLIYEGKLAEAQEKLQQTPATSEYAWFAKKVADRLTLGKREAKVLGGKSRRDDDRSGTGLLSTVTSALFKEGGTSPRSSPAGSPSPVQVLGTVGAMVHGEGSTPAGSTAGDIAPYMGAGAQALSASAYHRYYVEHCTVPTELADLQDRAANFAANIDDEALAAAGSAGNVRRGKRSKRQEGSKSPRPGRPLARSGSQSSGTPSVVSSHPSIKESPFREAPLGARGN